MAERLIDAEAFLQAEINRCGCVPLVGTHTMNNEYLSEMLKSAPTIEAKPVIHAYWIKEGNERTCSDCGFFYYSNKNDFYYCPKCGAQMDKVVSKADELDSLEKPNSQSGAENE